MKYKFWNLASKISWIVLSIIGFIVVLKLLEIIE